MSPWSRCTPALALFWLGCGSTWKGADNDGDGLSAAEGDCWDALEGPVAGSRGADIFPGAPDAWYDGLDADCAGDDDFDADGDGFVPEAHRGRSTFGVEGSGALPAGDCLDLPDAALAERLEADEDGALAAFVALHGLPQPLPSAVYPGAPDALYDDVDADCAGLDADEDGLNDDFDGDGDGFAAALAQRDGTVGGDCADGAPGEDPDVNRAGLPLDQIFPGAADPPYDGADQDCSGVDTNGDGLLDDCDQDLDGSPSDDADDGDGDGCFIEDCNDLDPRAVPDPSVAEVYYNGVDDNCLLRVDGEPDLDGDADGDGFWAADYPSRVPRPDATVGPLPAAFDDCWDDPSALPAGWVERRPQRFDPRADWTAPGEPAYAAALGPAEVHPGALDRPYDGLDQDCRGEDTNSDGVPDDFDWDGDGAASLYQAGPEGFGDDCLDCADACLEAEGALAELCAAVCDDDLRLGWAPDDNLTNRGGLDPSAVAPGAVEVWGDGTDGDCSRGSDYDADGDFFADARYSGSPWSFEAERPFYYGDGDVILGDGDCNDRSAGVYPGATDLWYDGVDADCAGDDDFDADRDGHVRVVDAGATTSAGPGSAAFGGGLPADDCDDTDPLVFGAGVEVWYDGVDGDCDGRDDYDQDGDGYADLARAADYGPTTYVPGSGLLPTTDCNDTLAAVYPDAAELWYDGIDADCAGDDDFDVDLDGYVPSTYAGRRTNQGAGTPNVGPALPAGDCDDTDGAIRPGAVEVCDGRDNDCDALTDDADTGAGGVVYTAAHRWYPDADGDTYGQNGALVERCAAPAGHVDREGDCDDGSALVQPEAVEVCDGGLDNNCRGGADDADPELDLSTRLDWILDLDGDGFGAGPALPACAAPPQGVLTAGDCDDARAAVNPAAAERCNAGRDDDCDGLADEADPSLDPAELTDWYADVDGDGFGAAGGLAVAACVAPPSRVADDSDCDDTLASVNPGLDEVCNDGEDNDCDGTLGTTAAGGRCAYAAGPIADADQLFFTGTAGEELGYGLAFVPRLDAPGAHHLLLGAPRYDNGTGGSARDFGAASLIIGQASWGLSTNTTAAAFGADRQTWRGQLKDDLFGAAVGAGDFDGDGVVELFFGAPGWDNGTGGSNANYGRLYMIDLPASGDLLVRDIGLVAGVEQRGGGAQDRFLGAALAVAYADGVADDYADLLIGAPECSAAMAGLWGAASATVGGPGRALYVQGGPTAGALAATPAIRWEGANAGGCAGGAVLWADLVGDGVMEAIIAEPHATGSGAVARGGRVYVDDLTASGVVSLADLPYLWASETDSQLGRALAAGDLDGDGRSELILGEATDGSNSGAVYLIAAADLPALGAALPEAIAHTTLLGDAADRFLGSSVAVPGDVDGAPDGLAELYVGAHQANVGGGGGNDAEGAVYLLSGPLMVGGTVAVGPSSQPALRSALKNAWLGDRLIAGGDLNDDGLPDAVIVESQGAASRGAHVLLGLGY